MGSRDRIHLPPVDLDAIEAEASALVAAFIAAAPLDDVGRYAAVVRLRVCADIAAGKYRHALRLALSLYVHDAALGVPAAVGLSQAEFRKKVMEAIWMTSYGTGIGDDLEQALGRVKYYPQAAHELTSIAPKALLARSVYKRSAPVGADLVRELIERGVKRTAIAMAVEVAEEPDVLLLDRMGYERPRPYGE